MPDYRYNKIDRLSFSLVFKAVHADYHNLVFIAYDLDYDDEYGKQKHKNKRT